MSSTLIVICVVAGLFILIGTVYVYQLAERSKLKKLRHQAGLGERIKRLDQLLDSFPPNFLSQDLRILILRTINEYYMEMYKLNPDEVKIPQRMEDITQKMDLIKSEGESTKKHVARDLNEARELRALLKNLYQFVVNQHKQKRIDKQTAQYHIDHIRQMIVHTSLDTYIKAAETAVNSSKLRLAAHYYDMAAQEIKKQKKPKQYIKEFAKIEQAIKEIKKLQKSNKEKPAAEAQNSNTPKSSTLNSEWDEFGDDTSGWEKKRRYD